MIAYDAAFAGVHHDIHHAIADGNLVAVNSTMNGRHTAPWAVYTADGAVDTVFPPTNKTFAATQSHWFRIEDGMIVEHWDNRDDLGMARQLGWIPPTPAYLFKMARAKRSPTYVVSQRVNPSQLLSRGARSGRHEMKWAVTAKVHIQGHSRPCRLVGEYEFADARILRGVYRRDSALLGRNMLLEGRFFGLRFYFGVRVTGVIDEERDADAIVRLGFFLFGRWTQRRFYGNIQVRITELVRGAQRGRPLPSPAVRPDGIVLAPGGVRPHRLERLAQGWIHPGS